METQVRMNIEEKLDEDTRLDRVKLMTNDSTAQTLEEMKNLYKKKMDVLHTVSGKQITSSQEGLRASVERCQGQGSCAMRTLILRPFLRP